MGDDPASPDGDIDPDDDLSISLGRDAAGHRSTRGESKPPASDESREPGEEDAVPAISLGRDAEEAGSETATERPDTDSREAEGAETAETTCPDSEPPEPTPDDDPGVRFRRGKRTPETKSGDDEPSGGSSPPSTPQNENTPGESPADAVSPAVRILRRPEPTERDPDVEDDGPGTTETNRLLSIRKRPRSSRETGTTLRELKIASVLQTESETLQMSLGRRVSVASDVVEPFDDSRADTPTGSNAFGALDRILLSQQLYAIIALGLKIGFAIVLTDDVRQQIEGPFFTISVVVAVVVALTAIEVVMLLGAFIVRVVVLGPPVAGPGSVGRRQLLLAVEAAHHFDYEFTGEDRNHVERFQGLDRKLREQRMATGDETLHAIHTTRSRDGDLISDTLESSGLEVWSAFVQFETLADVAFRITSIVFYVLMTLTVVRERDAADWHLVAQISTGLTVFAGAMIMILLGRWWSRASLHLDVASDEVSASDLEFLESLKGRSVYPTVVARPGFYKIVRQYLMIVLGPATFALIGSAGLAFLCPTVFGAIWPGTSVDLTADWSDQFLGMGAIAGLYLVGFWITMVMVEGLRHVLRPALKLGLSGVVTVFLVFLIHGDFDLDDTFANLLTALPGAMAAGIASMFWSSKSDGATAKAKKPRSA